MKATRVRLYDEVGVWEALINDDYCYFEAPPHTDNSQLLHLAVEAYRAYRLG